MQFLVIGRDGNDAEALERRMAHREAHIAATDQHVQSGSGHMILGAALLNDQQEMCGSAMVVDFDSREELDEWLKTEPYAANGVWATIKVEECRVGPSFAHLVTR